MAVAHRECLRKSRRVPRGHMVDRLVTQNPAATYAATVDGFSNVTSAAGWEPPIADPLPGPSTDPLLSLSSLTVPALRRRVYQHSEPLRRCREPRHGAG